MFIGVNKSWVVYQIILDTFTDILHIKKIAYRNGWVLMKHRHIHASLYYSIENMARVRESLSTCNKSTVKMSRPQKIPKEAEQSLFGTSCSRNSEHSSLEQ